MCAESVQRVACYTRSVRLWLLSLAVFVGSLACSEGPVDSMRPTDSSLDAGPRDTAPPDTGASTRPADPPGDETYDYVVRIFMMGDQTSPTEAPGFNLDGLVSTGADPAGCRQADWTAPDRYGGYVGVDNQLPLVLSALEDASPDGMPNDVDGRLAPQVDSGEIVILFRLSGVGSFENDGLVSLALLPGNWDGEAPPEKETISFRGEDRVVNRGGQVFRVDPAGIVDGDLDRPRTVFRDAWIEEGRLHTTATPFSIRLSLRHEFVFEMDDGYAEGMVSPTGITDMVVGGSATKDEIFRLAATFDPSVVEEYQDLARLVLDSLADIDADPEQPGCEAISLSLLTECVDAVLVAP